MCEKILFLVILLRKGQFLNVAFPGCVTLPRPLSGSGLQGCRAGPATLGLLGVCVKVGDGRAFVLFILKGFFKKDFIYFRERKRGRKRGRETSMCGCLSNAPYWGPGPQPRHVPWLGIEPANLWFTDWRSIHWATPARAALTFLRCAWMLHVCEGIGY